MKILILALFVIAPVIVSAQTHIKKKFQKQIQLDKEKDEFQQKLLILDNINKSGLNLAKIDSLKSSGNFEFMMLKSNPKGKQLILDLPQYLAAFYVQFENAGLVKHLKSLRTSGQLKVASRNIASDIEPPKKTNNKQSYKEFYLEVIKKLLIAHKSLLSADELDFETYNQWEKEQNLLKESDVTAFRLSFIMFLYKYYNIR